MRFLLIGKVVKKKLRRATQLRLAKIKKSRHRSHPTVPCRIQMLRLETDIFINIEWP